MAAPTQPLVDELCKHLHTSAQRLSLNLEAAAGPSPPSVADPTPEILQRTLVQEMSAIAPALLAITRARRQIDEAADPAPDPDAPTTPETPSPSNSLVEELCDQLEDNLSWPVLDLLTRTREHDLPELLRERLDRTQSLLRRCSWTSETPAAVH